MEWREFTQLLRSRAAAPRSPLAAPHAEEKARRLALTAADPDELRRQQRQARHLRHWQDELGMTRISAALLPEDGTALLNRLASAAERLRREDPDEPWEAHAADALVEVVLRGGEEGRHKADVVLVCDY